MLDKQIQPHAQVFLKHNIFEEPRLEIRMNLPIPFRFATVISRTSIDPTWGQRWLVQTKDGNEFDVAEHDLSLVPKISSKESNRGFAYRPFEDLYGSDCSVQESSLATDDAIWLGVDVPFESKPPYNEQVEGHRMHLSRGQVAALLPLLECFVRTGFLPK